MIKLQILLSCLFGLLIINGKVFAQEKEKYILGDDQKLEMIVHVFGEVQNPGEYRVPDNTNVLELISKAGGPTVFSNLNSVIIKHIEDNLLTNNHNGTALKKGEQIIKYNVNDYLKKNNAVPPPRLKPGDIVVVSRNRWHKWRNTFTIIRDLSVIASVYLLYVRATN